LVFFFSFIGRVYPDYFGTLLYIVFFIEPGLFVLHLFFGGIFKFVAFASTAGGQRNRNAATFGSLKKLASHFFNPHCVWTEPKEAANPVTGYDQSHHTVLCIYLSRPAV
jgi:hypothetical protein